MICGDDYNSYNRFYYNNICHVCKEANQNLKRCSACKTVAYCSKTHQHQDWTLHKDLCRSIVKSDRLRNGAIYTFDDFKKWKVYRSLLWIQNLSRELLGFECQMWMFPRVCAVCFTKTVTIDCIRCLNASYCSEFHKNVHEEHHSNFCAALKLGMDIDLYQFKSNVGSLDVNVCDFKDELTELPKNFRELMSMYDKAGVPKENGSDEDIRFIIKSKLVAPAATILYGLEKSGLLINRLFNEPKLTVHIVGASAFVEMGWLWKLITELHFHWIKNLKKLDFYVVGPELHNEGNTDEFAKQLCDSCKAKCPVTNIFFHSKLYHEVVSKLEKPDIVVAFNSGLHESGENLWHESINSLTKYSDVPLLLTAYTSEEIYSDVETVRTGSSQKVEVILEPQVNPFANLAPIRDWESEDSPVFYINGYIAVLKAK